MVKELGGATAVPSFEWVLPLRKAPRGRVKQRSNVAEAQMTVRIPTVPWIDGPRQDLWFSSLSHSLRVTKALLPGVKLYRSYGFWISPFVGCYCQDGIQRNLKSNNLIQVFAVATRYFFDEQKDLLYLQIQITV
ncbi:hypothetical protein V1477_000262 [Vespula maculifrons]|uniref:Uncharacterized protein n=1 Tax=Vespula maculifrons TaxID=7453 RepID=A0ABD2D157_VESMC